MPRGLLHISKIQNIHITVRQKWKNTALQLHTELEYVLDRLPTVDFKLQRFYFRILLSKECFQKMQLVLLAFEAISATIVNLHFF